MDCDWVGLVIPKLCLVFTLKHVILGSFGLFSTRKDKGGPKLMSMGFGEFLGLMDPFA